MTLQLCIRAALSLASLLILFGCNKSTDQASGPKPSATPTPPAAAATPSPTKQPNAATAEAASTLVSTWLESQNSQSFVEYEGLYAERFHGVKRAGDITTTFDRKGWLRDRKGMFASPFHVSIEGLNVRLVGETAVADFQQIYQGQHYADRGPKQLVMVVDGGKLKIAREELLRSGRGPGQFENGLNSADFSFIREIEERRFWVVGDVRPSDQPIGTAPERVGVAAAFAKLSDKSKLPAQLQKLVGASLAVEPGMQSRCIVKLTDWGVLAELEPHFSVRDRWSGLGDEKLTDEQAAREIFGENGVSGTDQRFAVDVTEATKGCASTRWGRLESLGDVEHFEVEEVKDPEPTLLASVVHSLRKTKSYKDLERSYRDSESEGAFSAIIADGLTLYRARVGTDTYLVTTFVHLTDCHGFNGEATQLWRMRGRTLIEMQSVLPVAIRPEFAVDLNKDGIPEWVSDTQFIAWDGRRYTVELDVTPMNYDCPC